MKLLCLIKNIKRCDNCGEILDENNNPRDCIGRDERNNINERLLFCNKLNCIFDYAEKNKELEIRL